MSLEEYEDTHKSLEKNMNFRKFGDQHFKLSDWIALDLETFDEDRWSELGMPD